MTFPVEVPDREYWRRQVRCQYACPVRTDARGYVRAIADGNDELAYLIARGPNPLASICGCVCGAPCESACRRGEIDKPVAIRALKGYVCGRFGPESRPDGGKSLVEFLKDAARRHGPRSCQGREDLLGLLQSLLAGKVARVSGKSAGVVGSGPAGLAAAHDLALLGFRVTIYEMEPVLAGMLALGIPEYRLPRDLIRAEVEVITSLGVEAITGCTIGRDVTLQELRARHDAVIIAVGAKRSRSLPIPGVDAGGVLGGVEFLRDVALGRPPPLGERVVVIGGGNVAYDVSRTVVRQTSLDVSRTALRAAGVRATYLCSLESLEEMPADDVEIIEGEEEGIIRRNGVGPKEILVDGDGRVRGVLFQKCLRVFDGDGRFRPQFDPLDTTTVACDTVIVSIGQRSDVSFVDSERGGIELTAAGGIRCDPETGATSAPDVFVAGDLAHGPKLLIHAVASGKAVARTVYARVTGRQLRTEDTELHFPLRDYRREAGYESLPRQKLRTLAPEMRLGSQSAVVEVGLTPEEARREASRCLDCGVNTIFDGQVCILCGGCVDVCPEMCLRIVSLERLEAAVPLGPLVDGGEDPREGASAIIKDEARCIRCALCAERCPSGAITMERLLFEEALTCVASQ